MDNSKTFKYLEFQQARLLNHKQAKNKIQEEYTKRVTSLIKSELNATNLIEAKSTPSLS